MPPAPVPHRRRLIPPASARPGSALPRRFRLRPAPRHCGALVLGRTNSVTPAPVTFEPNEFIQHAAFLGGTGSGKTTAALNLIEQLLARDVPAVLLDRKGDLCRYADPAAWDRPLGDPARAAARQALRDKLDVALFTPGEPNGRPLALPVVPPGFDQLPEADRERFAQYAAAALGSMIGFKSSDADITRLGRRRDRRNSRDGGRRRCGVRHARLFFLHQRRALAEALAQIGQLGAADRAFALDFHLVHARRVQRENALHAFAVADAADGEHLVQPATAPANDHAGKNLDALFVAFDHFGVHAHGIAHREIRGVLAKLFRFNFI